MDVYERGLLIESLKTILSEMMYVMYVILIVQTFNNRPRVSGSVKSYTSLLIETSPITLLSFA